MKATWGRSVRKSPKAQQHFRRLQVSQNVKQERLWGSTKESHVTAARHQEKVSRIPDHRHERGIAGLILSCC